MSSAVAPQVWSVVRVPGPAVEDRRQLHRDRWALSTERNRHINRIKGLLATQGVSLPVNSDHPGQLEKVRTWDGSPLAPGLARRLLREHERLQLVDHQVKSIEKEQRQTLRTSQHPSITMVRDLMRLKSIHIQTAWPLLMELYSWREFQNGKEIGAIVGLEPVPYQSGGMSRERGLSKCGNARLRSLAVEFAWQWLIHQPDSELTIVPALRGSQWFEKRFGRRGRLVRKIGIVALARKLLVILWRYLETGVIPKGAALKAVAV
jgi:transposase